MKYNFLLIGENIQTPWIVLLQEVLSTVGRLSMVAEKESLAAIMHNYYDLIIIDARVVDNITQLLSHIRTQQSDARIIVTTASPTWTRAREALQAGADDYIDQALNKEKLANKIKALLEAPSLFRQI